MGKPNYHLYTHMYTEISMAHCVVLCSTDRTYPTYFSRPVTAVALAQVMHEDSYHIRFCDGVLVGFTDMH